MPAATLSATEFDPIRAENTRLQTEVKRLSALVEKLTFQLAMLKRMQFGQKSEASARMGDLFGTPTDLEQPSAPPKAPPRVTLPPNLPIKVVMLDLPEADKLSTDGTPLVCIGEETSDRLAVTPGRWFVKRTMRPKYADPALPENGVRCAPLPARVIDGGLLDESVLADIAIRKFDDHLPLHRISGRSCASMRSRHSHIPVHRNLLPRWRRRSGQANIERCGAGLRKLAGTTACRRTGSTQSRSRAARG